MLQRLSRVIALPLAPILFAQGRRLRRIIPRLPDAALPWVGELDGPAPLRLLVLGDSTAAGVGAATQDAALPGYLAREFRSRLGRGTVWTAIGRNGATARDLITDHLAEASAQPFDVIFLTIGANDALGMRSRSTFSRDVRQVVDALRSVNPNALILVSLMPRFDRFASLRNPVRWNLALHAASLDAGARASVAGMDNVFAIPKPPPYTETFWASDGFHPGPDGYREWAEFALGEVPAELLDALRRE
jgi:lysophospholipase L1-like esterase